MRTRPVYSFTALLLSTATAMIMLSPLAAPAAPPEEFVRGRVLVRFRAGTPSEQARAALASLQARATAELTGIAVQVVELPAQASEAAYVQAFRARPDVEFAELDRILPPADVTPNDPWYPNEWHLRKIAAPTAWATSTGSASIIIAILDTGVDGSHEDLAPKMVQGWNVYDGNSNTADVYGHGTRVAGTAAAASNNGIGVASVAWQCLIMPVRVSATNGTATYSAIASGLTWAADHGARVANISYTVTGSSTVTSGAQYFRSKGGVVAVSAGNDSIFDFTSDNPYVLTVSATDPADALYSWSNTGNNIDLAAPGCVYTPVRGGGYSSGCGTSFSAPVVAGVAALVLSLQPGLTPDDLTNVLRQSADDLGPAGWDSTYGWGRVNAARAVGASGGGPDTNPPAVSFASPSNGATVAGTITVQVNASDNVGVTSVTIAADGAALCTLASAPYSCAWSTTAAANGAHTLSATARDAAGNTANTSVTVTVNNQPPDTTPPSIAITSPAAGSTVSGSVPVLVTASDNVGVAKVELYVDGVLTVTTKSAPFTTKWNARRASPGAHTLRTKAYDQAGNSAFSAAVTVYK